MRCRSSQMHLLNNFFFTFNYASPTVHIIVMNTKSFKNVYYIYDIFSAFSIASTPVSQCSTPSVHTNRSVSFSGSVRDRTISSRESTPSRELGKLFNSLSLGDELNPPKRTPILRQRRGDTLK